MEGDEEKSNKTVVEYLAPSRWLSRDNSIASALATINHFSLQVRLGASHGALIIETIFFVANLRLGQTFLIVTNGLAYCNCQKTFYSECH